MRERFSRLARRSFLTKAGAGVAALGAAIGTGVAPALAQSAPPGAGRWQPAHHAEDDWFDELPGKHRFFIDTVSATGLAQAIFYANNYFNASKDAYGLEYSEVALVICARHASTPFAYTDAMWAKYGSGLSERADFTDPKTSEPPTVNVLQAASYGRSLPNLGVTLNAFIEKGGHLAVCQLATRAAAGTIARQTGGNADAIYKELVANLVGNAHMVPAGIISINRAQERGYSFAYTG